MVIHLKNNLKLYGYIDTGDPIKNKLVNIICKEDKNEATKNPKYRIQDLNTKKEYEIWKSKVVGLNMYIGSGKYLYLFKTYEKAFNYYYNHLRDFIIKLENDLVREKSKIVDLEEDINKSNKFLRKLLNDKKV